MGYIENSVQYIKIDKMFLTSYFGNSALSTGKRLRLDQIKDYDSLLCQINRYVFNYNNTGDIPDRLSFACDVFGFYNGENNNTSFLLSSSNRTPNSTKAQYTILKKIIYPTSGYSEFDYEYDLRNGGLRILEVRDYDNLSSSLYKSRHFEYMPSNVYTPPSFSESITKYFIKQNQPIALCNQSQIGDCYSIYTCSYLRKNSSQSSSIYEQYCNYRRYEIVREINGSLGEGGYSEYKFDYPKTTTGSYLATEIGNLESQLVEKTVYEKTNSTFRLISKKEYSYQIPEILGSYFSESSDIRIKNSWGFQINQISPQFSGSCTK